MEWNTQVLLWIEKYSSICRFTIPEMMMHEQVIEQIFVAFTFA